MSAERELLKRLVYIANERKPGDDGLYDFLTAIKDAEALLAQPELHQQADKGPAELRYSLEIGEVILENGRLADEAVRYIRADLVQPERKPLAYIPADVIGKLEPPKLILRDVPMYTYEFEGSMPIYTQPERKPPSRPQCLSFALEFLGEPEASELLGYIEALERPTNAVERALQPKWSDQPPTVPGWYWFRKNEGWPETIIRGLENRAGLGMDWYEGDADMVCELSGQWAGPIAPPEE